MKPEENLNCCNCNCREPITNDKKPDAKTFALQSDMLAEQVYNKCISLYVKTIEG